MHTYTKHIPVFFLKRELVETVHGLRLSARRFVILCNNHTIMDGLSVLWWTCMKHCEWVLYICMCYRHLNNYNTCFYNRCTHAHIHTYILYTHTHCLSGTKHSLTRCNCQVRGPVIFCSLRTNWFMKWACRNAHTTKHFKVYIHTCTF